ncbi:MAG: LicD family protein [Thermoplasmatota archaeon]
MAWLRWRCTHAFRMVRAGKPWLAIRHPIRTMQRMLQRHGVDVLKAAVPDGAFLAYGTLLGIVRDGHLIPHDDDMDVGVFQEDWDRIVPKTIPGFARLETSPYTVKFVHKKTGLVVDFFRFHPDGEHRRAHAGSDKGTHTYLFPRELLEPLGTIEWEGRTWTAPADPEGFLAHHYGADWRTPLPAWDYRTDAASDKTKQPRN